MNANITTAQPAVVLPTCDTCDHPVQMIVDGIIYGAACLCDRDAAEHGADHGVALAPFFSTFDHGAAVEDLPF